jgi:hypothetical protein
MAQKEQMMLLRTVIVGALLLTAPALAQDEEFSGDAGGAMRHIASGFVCPLKLAGFERDAVGQRSPELGADYCAYSALSGVYGTIILMPLPKTYDPRDMLTPEFSVQESAGGRMIDETVTDLGGLPVYLRTYETAHFETLKYRMAFASAATGAWAVQVILEYAYPRDKESEAAFLNSAYAMALKEIGTPKP